MSTFGLKLRELRNSAGLTQGELAEKAGINRVTLTLLETDSSVPSWPTVLALAKALGVGCEEFPDVAKSLKGTEKRTKPAATDAAKKPAPKKGKG